MGRWRWIFNSPGEKKKKLATNLALFLSVRVGDAAAVGQHTGLEEAGGKKHGKETLHVVPLSGKISPLHTMPVLNDQEHMLATSRASGRSCLSLTLEDCFHKSSHSLD